MTGLSQLQPISKIQNHSIWDKNYKPAKLVKTISSESSNDVFLATIDEKLVEGLAIWFSHFSSCKKINGPPHPPSHRKLLMNPSPPSIETHCLCSESFSFHRHEDKIGNFTATVWFLLLHSSTKFLFFIRR